jgi:hypothetical protein
MADRALGNEIRRLVDEQVPAAPWLEDRVMAAVLKDAAGRNARRFDGQGARLVIALAAAIIAVLAVAVLVGTRLAYHPTLAPATKPSPSRDAAVLRYQALINSDARPIANSNNGGWVCRSNQQCIALANQTRAEVEALLHDVESTTAPTSLVPAAAQLRTAAQQYIAELDAYIAAEQDPNTNYLAPTGPVPTNLDIAVATVACWPGVPDVAGGEQSIGNGSNGYACTVQPPTK